MIAHGFLALLASVICPAFFFFELWLALSQGRHLDQAGCRLENAQF